MNKVMLQPFSAFSVFVSTLRSTFRILVARDIRVGAQCTGSDCCVAEAILALPRNSTESSWCRDTECEVHTTVTLGRYNAGWAVEVEWEVYLNDSKHLPSFSFLAVTVSLSVYC